MHSPAWENIGIKLPLKMIMQKNGVLNV